MNKISNKIPSLANNDGLLTGGFSSLSIEQTAKIKGGANTGCKNTSDCIRGSNNSCTNTSACIIDATLE